jgi:hypothetical protein
MRKYLLVAVASSAICSPAVARDNSWYVGIEGAAMNTSGGGPWFAPFPSHALEGARPLARS